MVHTQVVYREATYLGCTMVGIQGGRLPCIYTTQGIYLRVYICPPCLPASRVCTVPCVYRTQHASLPTNSETGDKRAPCLPTTNSEKGEKEAPSLPREERRTSAQTASHSLGRKKETSAQTASLSPKEW